MNAPLVTGSVLLYNAAPYLPLLLPALLEQTYAPIEWVLIDNGSQDNTAAWIQEHYPQLRLLRLPINVGFAEGHNRAIRETRGEFIFCVNQDALPAPDYVEKTVAALQAEASAGSVQGVVWQLDKLTDLLTAQSKTHTIDTLGLKIFRSRRVVNIGEGEQRLPPNGVQEVFGVTGTLPMYRRSALAAAAEAGDQGMNFFDPAFFLYKEDIDLAWRLQLAGFRALLLPAAQAFHERGFRRQRLAEHLSRAPQLRRKHALSFINQHRLIWKCDRWQSLLLAAPGWLMHTLLLICSALINGSFMPALQVLWLNRRQLQTQRQRLRNQRRARAAQINRWFSATMIPYV